MTPIQWAAVAETCGGNEHLTWTDVAFAGILMAGGVICFALVLWFRTRS